MEWERIRKRAEDFIGANLTDYEQYSSQFTWAQARALLDGLPGGGLNIAHEARIALDRTSTRIKRCAHHTWTVEKPMKAADVMTRTVVSIRPNASIAEMVKLMLDNRISGLPVTDDRGELVGIVTEGDCLRRTETGTERKRPRWLEFLTGAGRLADEYTHSHSRKVADVMTQTPITIAEDTPLEEVVHLMESRRIKRLPVMRDGKVVGIVSRANLLQALASVASNILSAGPGDAAICDQIITELSKQPWAPQLNVTVRDGIVDLWGVIFAAHQREAAIIAAENVAGVKTVRSHVAWVDPQSGMVIHYPNANTNA